MKIVNFNTLKKNLKKDLQGMTEVKVALLGDSATQLLNQAIKGYGIEMNYNFNIYEADFDQVEYQVMDSSSGLFGFDPEFVIIYFSSEKLIEKFYMSGKPGKEVFGENFISLCRNLYSNINLKLKSKVLLFNIAEINDSLYGNYASKIRSSFLYQARYINLELMNMSREFNNLFIVDFSSIQNDYGRSMMKDNNIYYNTEICLSIDILPVVAGHITDIILSIKGIIKKCLILDLDNTLWGGVIGDDGIEKIQTGHLGIGKAFTDLQLWIKQLKERGIILAVCSKNDERIAKEPFESHPDMVLRLEDFSIFVANWENKADNIKYIQSILNIGFDSMVFLDDNPFERNFVRNFHPDITVPELPEDPANYLDFLRKLNLFETSSFTEEDEERTKQYQEEAKRKIAMTGFVDEKDFLVSLEMSSIIRPFDKFNIPRVAQLCQRSNQFNLRTVRYTEEEITAISGSDDHGTFTFTLQDKFGDNGLISVIILKKENDNLFIDTWIMSCRVLKRGMENFVLNRIVRYAFENNFKLITGEYLPTKKNGMVQDHYRDLGFEKKDNIWILDPSAYTNRENYIKEI